MSSTVEAAAREAGLVDGSRYTLNGREVRLKWVTYPSRAWVVIEHSGQSIEIQYPLTMEMIQQLEVPT